MGKIKALLGRLSTDGGQTLVEYLLLLVLLAVVLVLMLTGLGTTINNTYSEINSALPM